MAVALQLSGAYYYIIAAHYPSGPKEDDERADFETDLMQNFARAKAVHEA